MRSVEAKASTALHRSVLLPILIGCGRTVQLDDELAAKCRSSQVPIHYASVCRRLSHYFHGFRKGSLNESAYPEIKQISYNECKKLRLIGPQSKEYDKADIDTMIWDNRMAHMYSLGDFNSLVAGLKELNLKPVSRDSLVDMVDEWRIVLGAKDFIKRREECEAEGSEKEFLRHHLEVFLYFQSVLLRAPSKFQKMARILMKKHAQDPNKATVKSRSEIFNAAIKVFKDRYKSWVQCPEFTVADRESGKSTTPPLTRKSGRTSFIEESRRSPLTRKPRISSFTGGFGKSSFIGESRKSHFAPRGGEIDPFHGASTSKC
eukprot:Gregarina_sp_Poly_1__285@NODE_106_length_14132_cov_144_167721_g93_i0_p5_GENE_NODE_106_length_14132_cov_144_167721_g93_i0NODE_106_length_14132_cov_144_167721_g93_i0_p5_ORF_typecomplete_len318_score42_81_NODE_106_length_14132_cov_144_167721_g93_i016802633